MKIKSKYQMDMCSGPLLKNMLLFAIPVILTGTLQLLYNAADIIVVGQFAGDTALSAVGSTAPLINLLVNLFMGLSIGTSVVMSRYFGAYDYDGMQNTLHTSIAVALVAGFAIGVFGFFASEPLLVLMKTPENVLGQATLYTKIFFVGMPFNMLYTFGSAILRAVGDTKRPLYFLMISGLVNVILNLIFVIFIKMDVAGVALATIISQAVSMFFVLRCLLKNDGAIALDIKKIRIHKKELIMLVKIGLPAGIQGSLFSVSNVLIQSSINSFGSIAMAGNAAASSLEGFVYIAMNAIHQTNVSFTSANMGAKNYHRVRKVIWYAMGIVTAVGLGVSLIIILFSNNLIALYNSDTEVIRYGTQRIMMICSLYFMCGWMDVIVGHLRGLGYSLTPMAVTLIGVCALRVVWIYTIFANTPTLEILYISYPVTWLITTIAHFVTYAIIVKKIPKENGNIQ